MAKASRATLQARSEAMDKDIEVQGLREQIERLETDLKTLRGSLDLHRSQADTARAERLHANKERDDVLEENNTLRDRLHQSELQVARLEGMLERVREFDPVSDRDVYEDGKPRHEPPPIHNFDGALSAHRPSRWYDRRRQVA